MTEDGPATTYDATNEIWNNGFWKRGEYLVPEYNVDAVDINAGLRLAAQFGYDDSKSIMVLSYALRRHSRGEEDGAQRTALSGGIALTSWYAILAAGIAACQPGSGEFYG